MGKVRYMVMGEVFSVEENTPHPAQFALKLPKKARPGSRILMMAEALDGQRMASFTAWPDGLVVLRMMAKNPVKDDNEPWPRLPEEEGRYDEEIVAGPPDA